MARRDPNAVVSGPILTLPARQAALFEEARAQIEPYLPRGIDFQVVIADVSLAVRKNPDLLNCDPVSLIDAVIEVQQRGLRVGSTCHLVPKGGKVLAWNDYRGDIEMIIASGACRDVDAHPVYEGEPFHYVEHLAGPELRHEIVFDAKDRGALRGAYARFYLGFSRYRVKYLPIADIEAIRNGSLSWNPRKHPKCPPWYALKTAIRQGAKLLPRNRALVKVYAAFSHEEQEAGEPLGTPMIRDDDGTALPVDTATGELIGADVGTPSTEPAHGSLEWAQALLLPLSRSEFYNKPLGTLSRAFLEQLPAWCEGKMNAAAAENREVSPAIADLYTAVNLLLEVTPPASASIDAVDDADVPGAQAELIAETPKGAPAGSLRHDVPKPGKVEDAFGTLALGDEPKRPNRNAQEI